MIRKGTGQGSDPFIYSITKNGHLWFTHNLKNFKLIIDELNRLGYYKRSFRKENIKNFQEIQNLIEDAK